MSLSYRSYYLEQLGVHQWYARKRLLGAATSPDCLFEPDTLGQASADGGEVTAQSPAPSGQSGVSSVPLKPAASLGLDSDNVGNDAAKVLLREVVGVDEQEGESSASAAPSLATQRMHSPSAEHFSFRAYLVDNFLVTTSIGRDQPDAPERRLAENIVKACKKGRSSLKRTAVFEWPVFVRSGLHAHFSLSGDACLARWLSELCANEPEVHLHFGAQAEAFRCSDAQSGKLVVFDFTLSDMLSNTLLKADCWQRLLSQNVVADKRGGR